MSFPEPCEPCELPPPAPVALVCPFYTLRTRHLLWVRGCKVLLSSLLGSWDYVPMNSSSGIAGTMIWEDVPPLPEEWL